MLAVGNVITFQGHRFWR